MKKEPLVWIVAGTTEGGALIRALADKPIRIAASVATEYGAALLGAQNNLRVLCARLDREEMAAFLQREKPALVIDATHPYATEVTNNVKSACAAEDCIYLRLLRPPVLDGEYLSFADYPDAVEYLAHTEGPVFLTTGSNNLEPFTALANFAERITVRVLPLTASLEKALRLGFSPKRIICMQGPFSPELNAAMFKTAGARYIITKDSGTLGGVSEKQAAAQAVGAQLLVIARQEETEGTNFNHILAAVDSLFVSRQEGAGNDVKS